eukprot:TRINITY_DN84458_c0_g1_i1.p1 TRINITY_DN84458_c0_g1~~TRINITY_DN84458_c0_g1_i1.p1  ORF type:complete len:119 (+),score=7.76 TRINITY_DN84458_c0_g1_i1:228-584(+)
MCFQVVGHTHTCFHVVQHRSPGHFSRVYEVSSQCRILYDQPETGLSEHDYALHDDSRLSYIDGTLWKLYSCSSLSWCQSQTPAPQQELNCRLPLGTLSLLTRTKDSKGNKYMSCAETL